LFRVVEPKAWWLDLVILSCEKKKKKKKTLLQKRRRLKKLKCKAEKIQTAKFSSSEAEKQFSQVCKILFLRG
jgi:hypothetical protein